MPHEPIPTIWSKSAQAVVAAGARTVNLPDTVGLFRTRGIRRAYRSDGRSLGDRAIVSVHCHDDLGLAVANSLAAVKAGARQMECTINGIGERAGNAALEEVVMAFKTRHDRLPFETKIHTEKLYPRQPDASAIHYLRAATQ